MISFSRSCGWAAVVLAGDATIRGLSPGAQELTGNGIGALLGRPVSDILSDRSAPDAAHILAAARERGIWTGEIGLRDARGSEVRRRAMLSLLEGEEAEGGYLLLVRDDRARAASCADGAAGVSARLRAFAHRMNNPLAVMMGFAQLLMMEMAAGDAGRDHVARMYEEMRRLAEAVEELHEYALSLEPVPETKEESGLP